MIKSYKEFQLIDAPSQNCMLYKVKKGNEKYFMYELENYNQSDEYSFKVIKRIQEKGKVQHILNILEEFEQKGNKYYITELIDNDLLRMQLKQKKKVYPLKMALEILSKIFTILQNLHELKVVYRNIRPEVIKIEKDQPYLHDFSLSKVCKRNERSFDVVGCSSFLAPQMFEEDGYGQQVDIWACGVLLFFMLTNQHPFTLKGKDEAKYKEQFAKKCSLKFDFETVLASTSNPANLQSSKSLQNFFARVFNPDYAHRITISQIKKHPLFQQFYSKSQEKNNPGELQIINQTGNSLIQSKIEKFLCKVQFDKEMEIINFVEHAAQTLMIDGSELVDDQILNQVNFSAIKLGLLKIKIVLDTLYGLRQPWFSIENQQWRKSRTSTIFKHLRENFEKKSKILQMLFKTALLGVKNETDPFFTEEIPNDFKQIKIAYRNNISKMFEIVMAHLKKNAPNHRLMKRKLIQIETKLLILHLINRVFEHKNIENNLKLYFDWNQQQKSLKNLQSWISHEKIVNLKSFMKYHVQTYM